MPTLRRIRHSENPHPVPVRNNIQRHRRGEASISGRQPPALPQDRHLPRRHNVLPSNLSLPC